MIDRLDQTLEAFFRAVAPLPTGQIDVSFKAPDNDWRTRLTRPTVNLYLYEIRRSTTRAVTAVGPRDLNGTKVFETMRPLMLARYLVTVWTTEVADEHRVLGDLLGATIRYGTIPTEYLVAPLDDLSNPLELDIGQENDAKSLDYWSAFGAPPKAAIELTVTLPAMTPLRVVSPEPPATVDLGVADRDNPSARSETQRTGEAPPLRTRRGAGGAVIEEH